MRKLIAVLWAIGCLALTGCTSTTIQGYADRDIPATGVRHIATYIAAPGPLASNMQASVAEAAGKRGIFAEDALVILPPTRTYTDAEVRKALAERGVDGVLTITVADSGVISQYAGTIFSSTYNGSVSADGIVNGSAVSMNGTTTGTSFGTATPTFRYSRKTDFTAKLIDPSSGRNLWVGNGEVSTEGGKGLISRLAVTDSASASHAVNALFDDLQTKRLIVAATQ